MICTIYRSLHVSIRLSLVFTLCLISSQIYCSHNYDLENLINGCDSRMARMGVGGKMIAKSHFYTENPAEEIANLIDSPFPSDGIRLNPKYSDDPVAQGIFDVVMNTVSELLGYSITIGTKNYHGITEGNITPTPSYFEKAVETPDHQAIGGDTDNANPLSHDARSVHFSMQILMNNTTVLPLQAASKLALSNVLSIDTIETRPSISAQVTQAQQPKPSVSRDASILLSSYNPLPEFILTSKNVPIQTPAVSILPIKLGASIRSSAPYASGLLNHTPLASQWQTNVKDIPVSLKQLSFSLLEHLSQFSFTVQQKAMLAFLALSVPMTLVLLKPRQLPVQRPFQALPYESMLHRRRFTLRLKRFSSILWI